MTIASSAVALAFEMKPQLIRANLLVAENAGKAAVQRGRASPKSSGRTCSAG
ncbi:MAG: hypothetical protein AAB225_26240 [Acidobacteriota bacterium]